MDRLAAQRQATDAFVQNNDGGRAAALFSLPREALELLYWAERASGDAELARRLGISQEDLEARLRRLADQIEIPPRMPAPRAEPPYLERLWARAVERYPESTYLATADGSWSLSYGAAADAVRRAATALQAAGVQAGDRVAMDATPRQEAPILIWAVLLLGAVLVPIDGALPPNVMAAMIARCAPMLGVAEEALGAALAAAGVRTLPFRSLAEAPPAHRPTEWAPDQTGAIVFTSGSTGEPKGIELTRGTLYRASRTVAETWRLRASDRFFLPGAYHTITAVRNTLLAPVHVGASAVVPDDPFARTPFGVIETCRTQPVTVLSVVPALLKILTRLGPDRAAEPLSRLRAIVSVGAELTPETRRRFASVCQTPIFNYYGVTEACGGCIFQDVADPPAGLIGRPRALAARIENPDGSAVALGEAGELVLYGENVMKGYFGQPEATAKVLRDGWLRTGDIARYDENGSIYLAGRSRDIIKRPDGELVELGAVERLVETTGLVADVAACGYVDPHGDEAVIIFVSALPGGPCAAEDLLREFRAALGRTTIRDVMVVDSFPQTSSGKVQKHKLLELYAANRTRLV